MPENEHQKVVHRLKLRGKEMKILNCFGKTLFALIICLALTGGVVYSDDAEARGKAGALGGGGDSGVSVPVINNCNDCLEPNVAADANKDGVVSITDLMGVLNAVRTPGGCPPGWDCDVDKSGGIGLDDFLILRKCLGCSVTPSPFQ